MNNIRTLIVAGLLVGGVVIAVNITTSDSGENQQVNQSISGDTPENNISIQELEAKQSTQTALEINYAPDFELTDSETGETVKLSDFRGKQAVLIDFWATWCHNCQRSMPKINALIPKYKEQVKVLAVNLKESSGDIDNFKQIYDVGNMTFLLDEGSVARQYGIRYTNTHYLVNKDGELIKGFSGDVDESHFLELVN